MGRELDIQVPAEAPVMVGINGGGPVVAPPASDVAAKQDAWRNEVFQHHAPTPEQIAKYHEVREADKAFVKVIHKNVPKCADQSAAIRLVRESVMTANAAIALGGLV